MYRVELWRRHGCRRGLILLTASRRHKLDGVGRMLHADRMRSGCGKGRCMIIFANGATSLFTAPYGNLTTGYFCKNLTNEKHVKTIRKNKHEHQHPQPARAVTIKPHAPTVNLLIHFLQTWTGHKNKYLFVAQPMHQTRLGRWRHEPNNARKNEHQKYKHRNTTTCTFVSVFVFVCMCVCMYV